MRMTAAYRTIWTLALVSLLSSCGGGGGGSDSIPPLPTPGTLTVTIAGGPAGIVAGVIVTGPGSATRAVTASPAALSLPPGTYTITAPDMLNGTAVFTPQSATQTATVTAGGQAAITVTYANTGAFSLKLQEVANGFAAPVFLTAPAGDPRLFVVERAGQIRIVQNGVVAPLPFLDISARVGTAGEGGLLSMAFDPQYATNGFFYVYFTDTTGDIAIERFRVSGNPDIANSAAPLRILTITHRAFGNHKGGLVAFGPDGFLYLAPGDGGGAGDPLGNGQNLNSLLGKILRIDVSGSTALSPYAIPAGNPFAGQVNRRAEIWGYGLRNPWRYAFDTGTLYIADVGQARVEEVNAITVNAGAVNYGWNIMEGSLCFPAGAVCSSAGITLPVLEYDHGAGGGCSITGGYVYRGAAMPELRGRYLYSDFCSGWLRSFALAAGFAAERVDWNITNVGQIYSFGRDAQGELYMLADTGRIYRIVRG